MIPSQIDPNPTISAIATALGEGGIGIVRISGPEALGVADKIFLASNGKSVKTQKNFTVRHGHVTDKSAGRLVDEALLLVMRAPNSYTGEDVAELQTHGGPAILRQALDLTFRAGARSAKPGEFTKRAFLNGRLDLLQAEAVLDLIQAKSERAADWAARHLQGQLSKKIQILKENLSEILVHLEAAVDFPDDNPETQGLHEIEKKLKETVLEIEQLLSGSSVGILVKRGMRVALWGRPNVGKSSVMNLLAGSNRAIVTPVPGTTRDGVEEEISLDGFPFRLQDTAGIRETTDPIEKESIRRSEEVLGEADLVIFILDGSQSLQKEDLQLWDRIREKPNIIVINKADLPARLDLEGAKALPGAEKILFCSCLTDEGKKDLEQALVQWITQGKAGISEEPLISSARQKELLEKTLVELRHALKACEDRLSPEFVATDLKLALDHLGYLVGEVVNNDILEILFNKFCIGK